MKQPAERDPGLDLDPDRDPDPDLDLDLDLEERGFPHRR
jgi:hypothetical protein